MLNSWATTPEEMGAELNEQFYGSEKAPIISVELPIVLHMMLARMTDSLGKTDSEVVQEILSCAIFDAYPYFNFAPNTVEDVRTYEARQEGNKASTEEPPELKVS